MTQAVPARPGALIDEDVQRAIDRLNAGAVPLVLSAQQRELLLALMREGATITSVARREGFPSIADIYRTAQADPDFAAELDKARRMQATTRLDRAQDVLDAATVSGDIDDVRAAAIYSEQVTKYAAKIAPREYGDLVKIAGADGGALTVQVVDFSRLSAQPVELLECTPTQDSTGVYTKEADDTRAAERVQNGPGAR